MLNIGTKTDNVSSLPAAEFNSINDELKNLIQSSGQVLNGLDLYQIAKTLVEANVGEVNE